MISLPPINEYNAAPWELPLRERIKRFTKAKKTKKMALLLYHKADTSTFRYRCYNVMQILENSTKWGAVYFFESEFNVVRTLLEDAAILVLTRMKWTLPLDMLVAKAKARNMPIVYDVDDCVFDLDALKTVTNTLAVDIEHEYAYDFWFAYIARNQQAAALAEGFLTTNPYLGEKLKKKFGFPYQIIPNFLNKEQLELSEKLRQKKKKMLPQQPFTIGYFSGTPSHINDFVLVYKELMALLKAYPSMRLDVVGFMKFPDEIQPFIDSGQVRFIELVDFLELQRLIAQVDVNIVPLVENSFTNCKSELKYFEAAIVDTITLATPIYSYRHCIHQNETGFLCSAGQWYGVIEDIYLKRVGREKICDAAREDVLNRYCGAPIVEQIELAYESFL